MIYYTIYKTTNLVNGKIYIGKHKTKNPNDGYLGSGKMLSRAISKYGQHNFQKEILFFCESEFDMNQKEKELVDFNFCKNNLNYNLKPGGTGGFSEADYLKGYLSGVGALTFDQLSENGKLGYAKAKDQWDVKFNGSLGGKANKGKEKSPSHKKALSASIKGRSFNYPVNRKSRGSIDYEVVTCPHCNTRGKKNAMNRWHFDNCRNKNGPG